MPSRLLREGILTSERVERLDYPAEVFYRRLMSKVDDHGLYDARPSILRASLYPLRVDRVREADISRWLVACEAAGLIALYSAGGKQHLKMLNTGWDARSQPKYPLPPENICERVKTPVPVVGVEVVVEKSVGGNARKRAKRSLPDDFGLSPKVIEWAQAKGYGGLAEHLDAFRLKAVANDYRYADWDAALMNAIEADWAGVRSGRRPPAGGVDAWWTSDEGITRKGSELGMSAKPGETMASYRDRIKQRIEQARAA